MVFRSLQVALTIFIAAALAGCGDNPMGPNTGSGTGAAPSVPSSTTMNFDFSFFTSGRSTALGSPTAQAVGSHFFAAVDIADYFDRAVAARFYPAMQVIDLALSVEPVEQGDDSYLWTYSSSGFGHAVEINLSAVQAGNVVSWELRVSDNFTQPALDNFVWLRGTGNTENGSGNWIMANIDTGAQVDTDRIDYTVTGNDSQLRFELLDQSDEEIGNSLTFRRTGDVVTVESFDASDDDIADISWNESTGAGTLRFPHYNGGERACWDENLDDTTCSDDPTAPSEPEDSGDSEEPGDDDDSGDTEVPGDDDDSGDTEVPGDTEEDDTEA